VTVQKHSALIQVSREMLIDWGLGDRDLTPDELREREERRAELDRRTQAATQAWLVFVTALDAVTDPIARIVLDLHKNGDGFCRGCDFDGYEAESPTWPCTTTTTVAEALGIEVPEDLWMAEQARL